MRAYVWACYPDFFILCMFPVLSNSDFSFHPACTVHVTWFWSQCYSWPHSSNIESLYSG